MRLKILTILFILIGMIVPTNSYAQKTSTARFENISVQNGLSNDEITCIFQDSRGYMWIGTKDGLNRYDGQIIRKYNCDSKDENTLSSGHINDIEESPNGDIWVATDNGLDIIGYDEDKITRSVSFGNIPNLSDSKITSLLKSSYNEDIIWVGTDNGLIQVNTKNKNTKYFYYDKDNLNSLSSSYITCLEEDEDNNIWVGTTKGINIINKNSQIQNTSKKLYDNSMYVCSLSKDNLGNMWISTKEGIFKYNTRENKDDSILVIKNNEINRYYFESKESSKLHTFKDIEIDIYNDFIYVDSKNNPWMATSIGAVRYSIDEQVYTNFSNEIGTEYSITSNIVTCFYEDSNGTMWIGTDRGVNILNENTIFNEIYLNDKNIVSTLMVNNQIWVATKKQGIYIYDSKNEKLIDNFKINDDYITKVFKINDKFIAILTNEDIVYIDTTQEDYKQVKRVNNYSYGLNYMYSDEVDVWIANESDFLSLNIETNEKIYYSDNLRKMNINPAKITYILPDNKDKNILWLSGNSTGLIKFHKENGVIDKYGDNYLNENSLINTNTNCMTFDNLGNLWIGTNIGIGKFNINSNKFNLYTTSEGLTNNFINSILVDDNNDIWISTNNGLNKFDVEKNKFIKFTKMDGLNGYNFNLNCSLKLDNGNMIFGSTNGYVSFNPNDLPDYKKYENKVVIGDVYIVKTRSIYDNNEIVLEHDYKNLYINYFLPNYENIGDITYEYMLEGIDNNWIYQESGNSVDFKALEPGKYTLKIRARDGHGELSEETSLNITVKNPIWKTPLAYGIYALIILLIVTWTFNYVKILHRLVEQKTLKLNKQLEENKRLSQEIIDGEKNKNNYFVNLSHELRTPINVIVSTVQLINSLAINKKISYENFNRYMDIISNNCNSLLKIISDILDTSKIETGQYKINRENNDIVYIVEETALNMSKYIEEKGLSLIIDPDMEEQIIYCDKTEIERCIINLLGNAVKFTNEGGCITIYIKEVEDNIEITIEDTGIGISKEDQEFIFKRFSQVDNTGAIKASSSGIGLSLVKHIAELHGGYIKLESEVNVGSKFTIGLPNVVEKAENI